MVAYEIVEKNETPVCPTCKSTDVVLRGKRYNKGSTRQLLQCSDCNKVFTEGPFARLRQPQLVNEAKDLHEKGLSTLQIQSALQTQYGRKPARGSIMQWLQTISGNKQHSDKKVVKEMLKNKVILITGGTGTLGRALVKEILLHQPKVVRILDLDETEHFELEHDFKLTMPWVIEKDLVRFFVGDIKEKERVIRAMEGCHIVFHLAALKHVNSCEYNPFEAVKTNVLGTQNVIDAALTNNVEKVIFTSSDKAAYPHNTMGATKLLAERLITAANYAKGSRKTVFASVRFGNVMGSRGSVIPLFKKQIEQGGPVTITDETMTRFMMSQTDALRLVLKSAAIAHGGEIFILKMPIVKLGDLATLLIEHLAPKEGKIPQEIKKKTTGLLAGETHYEELMTEEEASRAVETKEMFVIPPLLAGTTLGIPVVKYAGKPASMKHYTSRSAPPLTQEELKLLLQKENLI